MAPRKYHLGKRAEAVQATRQRIIDAVVQLHAEKGIIATSWQEIAQRADVSLATVYRHFPTLNELVPACGARIVEITTPPDSRIFNGLRGPEERLPRLVGELFAFYARADRFLERALCDAAKVPALQAAVTANRAALEQLARSALAEHSADDETYRLTLALTDYHAWKAFATHGLECEAPRIVTTLLLSRLRPTQPSSSTEGA